MNIDIIKQKNGFTLLEVLIVVSIIIIIAGIALPRMLGLNVNARVSRVKGDLRVLQTAVEAYLININKVPGVGSHLEVADPVIVSDFSKIQDPFSTGGTSTYGYSTASATGRQYYVLFSVGTNGNGTASISTAGVLGCGSSAICVSNGK